MRVLKLLCWIAASDVLCGDDIDLCTKSRVGCVVFEGQLSVSQVLNAVHDADLQCPELYHPACALLLNGSRVDLHRWPQL